MPARLLSVVLALVLGLAAVPAARAQFVQYSFAGATGSEATFAPDAQPAGATASPMKRGTGLNPNAATDAFGANNFPLAAARDTAAYFSFTVTPDAGQRFAYTALTFDERRSGTGPRTWALYSSVDGFAAPLVTTDVPDDTNLRPGQSAPLGATFAGLGTAVTFRFYAYGAEALAGTWRIDNVRLDATTATSGPSVRFGTAPTSVSEAAGTARLVVLVNEPSATEATTVRLRTSGGTATAGQDYRALDTLLTVPAGATSLEARLTLLDDAVQEASETVVLTLESPSRGVVAAPSTFTLTLTDDDQPVTVRFGAAETVVFEGDGAVSLTLLLDGPAPTAAASVTLRRRGGTATEGSDYRMPTAPIAFAAGQRVAYADVTLLQDLVDEGEETVEFGLTITSGDPRLVVGTPGTLTLRIREQAAALGGTICPDLAGDPLLACLRAGYNRTTVVSYDAARTFLYGEFYPGPPYTGVYTGRMGPRGGGGSTTDLDTEHTWPQSKMPNQPTQEGEMHNLFPTISKANNDRGNLPFGEIADTLATGWYCPTGALPQAAPAPAERPLCSEIVAGVRFEPREDHKGNVARVLAYFATMYPPTATSDAFFRENRAILVPWNRLDPPDDSERARSAFIRTKQGNDNPYILDTTLVRRAFAISVAAEAPATTALALTLGPSPTRSTATLRGTLPAAASVSIAVFDVLGRRVLLLPAAPVEGAFARTLDVSALPAGVYYAQVRVTGALTHAQTFTLVRTP